MQFIYSIPSGSDPLLRRVLSSDQFVDFWNCLDLIHIILDRSSVGAVSRRCARACHRLLSALVGLVVLLAGMMRVPCHLFMLTRLQSRWFTLHWQAFDRTGPYVRMLIEIVKTDFTRTDPRQSWWTAPYCATRARRRQSGSTQAENILRIQIKNQENKKIN
jgi:hypothetical protein